MATRNPLQTIKAQLDFHDHSKSCAAREINRPFRVYPFEKLNQLGCYRVYADQSTGRKVNRAQLQQCLDYLREGDVPAFWGLYINFGHRAAHIMHEGPATAWGLTIGALAILPVVLLSKAHCLITLDIVPQAFLVALLSSAIPYSLEMLPLKRLPKLTFGILMSLEPAMAALARLWILNEQLSFTDLTAIGLIMGTSLGRYLALLVNAEVPISGT